MGRRSASNRQRDSPVDNDGVSAARSRLLTEGDASERVIEDLAGEGLLRTVASQDSRYFGFVTGGSLPVAASGTLTCNSLNSPAS